MRARIGTTAESSGVKIGGVVGAFECPAAVVGLRVVAAVDIAVVEHESGVDMAAEDKVLLVLAGYTATFCSCRGTVQGKVLVEAGQVGIPHSHPEAGEEAVRSCRIVVRCQSSSSPYRCVCSSVQR